MMLIPSEARLQGAAQVELLANAVLRHAERLERAAAGAEPTVLNAVRLLALAAAELAERARLVRGRIEVAR
jgi:hypothetical protein